MKIKSRSSVTSPSLSGKRFSKNERYCKRAYIARIHEYLYVCCEYIGFRIRDGHFNYGGIVRDPPSAYLCNFSGSFGRKTAPAVRHYGNFDIARRSNNVQSTRTDRNILLLSLLLSLSVIIIVIQCERQ